MLDKHTFVETWKDELPGTVPVAWDHARGPLDAAAVLVFYGAYSCPRAQRLWAAARDAVDRSTRPVRLVCRQLPGTSARSFAAALLSERAGERGQFWEAHELMFSSAEAADEAEGQLEGARHSLRAAPWAASLAAWDRIAEHVCMARALGVERGPALYLNGHYYSGEAAADAIGAALEASFSGAMGERSDAGDAAEASRILSMVSHELRGALSPLLLALSPTTRHAAEPSLPEEMQTRLDIARRQVRVLSWHLEHLAETHGGRPSLFRPHPLPGDLTPIVRAALASCLRAAARTGIRFNLNADPQIEGNWDPLRIEQILVNLVNNAIKYANAKPITVMAKKIGPFVRIAVRDQGEGMSREELGRLFRPHARLERHRNSPGMGLGLYIVRALAEAHRGRVFAVSEPGRGSTFGVDLPLSASASFAAGAADRLCATGPSQARSCDGDAAAASPLLGQLGAIWPVTTNGKS